MYKAEPFWMPALPQDGNEREFKFFPMPVLPDAQEFEGFVDMEGKFNGPGVVVLPSGNTYEGGWLNGLKHGPGRFVWASSKHRGDFYDGLYVEDRKHGLGRYTWANGDKYEGQWVNDNRQGSGTLTFVSGNKYEGQWLGDQRQGQGTYTWANGNICTGQWVSSKKHGVHLYYFASNGSTEQIEYDMDVLVHREQSTELTLSPRGEIQHRPDEGKQQKKAKKKKK